MSTTTPSHLLGALGQIAVSVGDVERATTFYRDVLMLPLLFEAGGMSFFDLAGLRLMIARAESEERRANRSTVLYFRVDDIGAAHDQLLARGVTFLGAPHLVARLPDHELWLAFFEDGEGNLLALMSEVR